MIPAKIAKKVLLVGPDYKNHRGGMGALIAVHKNQYEVFNFIPSFKCLNSNFLKSVYFVRQLLKIIYFLARNKEIQLVHLHSAKSGSLYRKLVIAYIAKVAFHKKIINHIHTGHFQNFYENSNWLGKKVIRFFLNLNDVTITVSDFWKTYFTTSFNLKNVYKINNMVEFAEIPTTTTNHDPVYILFLGLITPNKGIFDLLMVLAEKRALLKNRLKLVVGGYGQVDELKAIIQKNDLDEFVEYKGWVTGQEKEKLFQQADIFVLPSYYEGVPVSILEAMRFGKPIISTFVGGITEIVEQGINGLLIQPGDHAALFNSLLFYIQDPGNIRIHGKQSLLKIKNHYPEAIVPQLEHIYSSLIN
jgi:glycosyltransferase involved in cell wall biosynthesis